MKRTFLLAFVALSSVAAWAETRPPVDRLAGIKTKAEIEQVAAKLRGGEARTLDMDLFRRDVGATYRVLVNRVPPYAGPAGSVHPGHDELFVVYSGGAQMTVGGVLTNKNTITGGKTQHVGAGDVVSVPRGTPHEVHADAGSEIVYMIIHVLSDPPKPKT